MELFKKIYQSFAEIVFPTVCICCGTSTNSEVRYICSLCRTQRFENAGFLTDQILPETVQFVYNMWYFDKGGYLQELLHQLKYHFLRKTGVELGYLAGKHFLHSCSEIQMDTFYNLNPILVPVPLYPSKQRKRGYNQARVLAEGVSKSTGLEILESGLITRVKKTKTQTGLNLKQRSENLRGAFQIQDTISDRLQGRLCIIVDDVFTTGATTFELARTIHNMTGRESAILTVARA